MYRIRCVFIYTYIHAYMICIYVQEGRRQTYHTVGTRCRTQNSSHRSATPGTYTLSHIDIHTQPHASMYRRLVICRHTQTWMCRWTDRQTTSIDGHTQQDFPPSAIPGYVYNTTQCPHTINTYIIRRERHTNTHSTRERPAVPSPHLDA